MRVRHGFGVGEITTLPGCSQAAVLHGSYVAPEDRGKGRGYASHEGRLDYALCELGYELLICTVIETNLAEIAILKKAGWEKVKVFESVRTGNTVGLWCFVDERSSAEQKTYQAWEKSLERPE